MNEYIRDSNVRLEMRMTEVLLCAFDGQGLHFLCVVARGIRPSRSPRSSRTRRPIDLCFSWGRAVQRGCCTSFMYMVFILCVNICLGLDHLLCHITISAIVFDICQHRLNLLALKQSEQIDQVSPKGVVERRSVEQSLQG